MIVEHITRYSFDPITEAKELKRYMSMLPNWECEQVGTRCVTLSCREVDIVDKTEKTDVLDKIRANIEAKEIVETTSEYQFYNMALNDILQIIDKYKIESEASE